MPSVFPRGALAALLVSSLVAPAAWSQTRDQALFAAATAEKPAVDLGQGK